MKHKLPIYFKKYIRPLCIVVGFAILGVLIFISVRAAASYISREPENGTGTGVYVGTDKDASGGKYTRFGSAQYAGSGMSVSGNKLLRDGKPFMPHGFNMRGLLAGPNTCRDQTSTEAYEHFTEAEMQAATDWHANTLRFQISQPSLSGTKYPPAAQQEYLDTVIVPGVQLALSHGFEVILSMQTEHNACGEGNAQPSPNTVTSWTRVVKAVKASLPAPAFKNVMFEMFNEPKGHTVPAEWQQWLKGGDGPITLEDNHGEPIIGHQAVLDAIRAAGATQNVVIGEGMVLGKNLDGVPYDKLVDPSGLNQVAFAFHGYYYYKYKADWGARFGDLTAQRPVIMTEWHYNHDDCGQPGQTMAPEFIKYLQQHNIGMTPGPFDGAKGSGLIYDWEWSPTDCAHHELTEKGGGQFVKDIYTKEAADEEGK